MRKNNHIRLVLVSILLTTFFIYSPASAASSEQNQIESGYQAGAAAGYLMPTYRKQRLLNTVKITSFRRTKSRKTISLIFTEIHLLTI